MHSEHSCTGACESSTGEGCDCHPMALRRKVMPQPDQPWVTEPGDLSEYETDPGRSNLHAAQMLIVGALALIVLGFVLHEIYWMVRTWWPIR